ncbi:MAG TPA: hypothetical protein VMV49_15260 [Candidatus Deferrimicrobium sp.]|nr:hypothetical protein [Candidatus Deferrimicrobium sp.]
MNLKRRTLFLISAWGTILIGIWIIFGAFDPFILIYGDFNLYLILIGGIIGIIGAIISLGVLSVIGGLVISGGMLYLGVIYGFELPILFAFLKAVFFILGGTGIILTFEEPILYSSLLQLRVDKTEYFQLKEIGINTIDDLIEEKGNEEEVCAITSISLNQLKGWIKRAEEIHQEEEQLKRDQLKKDFKQKYKK